MVLKREKTDTLLEQVIMTIEKHMLLSFGDSVIAGFSGGPDSTCLVKVLSMLKKKYGLKLHAVYVNHNLRVNEIQAEIDFCSDFCKGLGIDFSVKSIDVLSYSRENHMNKQEAARHLRYMALQDMAYEIRANKIALAHNADDQAETLLMRIARGSGPAGLTGIPIRRGNIIRPLIQTERRDIETFLEAHDISAVIDSSNLKTDYFRNMLRHKVMPILKQSNPSIVATISNTMDILLEEERYFEITVTKALMKLISRKTDKRIELFLSPMESMDKVILRRVLRRAVSETAGLRGIGFQHIENIIQLIKVGVSGDRIILPKGIRIIKDYSVLVMTTELPLKIPEYDLTIPGEAVIVGAGIVITASLEDNTASPARATDSILLDTGLLKSPLKVRSRKAGDFFYPAGFGKRKKLQDFFVDCKVPRDERDSVPIICSGDDIVWVAGYRGDERFKATENTKKFVRLAILKGKF